MRKLRTNTAEPVVLTPIWPNVGVQVWYEQTLDRMINEATVDLMSQVARAWHATPPIFNNAHFTAAYGDELPKSLRAREANAAGVIFQTKEPKPRILLLERVDGMGWAFPGGTMEPGETPLQTAKREVWEEIAVEITRPMVHVHTQAFGDVHFATFVDEVEKPFNYSLNDEHISGVWVTVEEALTMRLHVGVRRTLELMRDVKMAQDAPSPTKALQLALQRWANQTTKKFDLAAEKIADAFATRSRQATQAAMMAQLKRAGFTVKFESTLKSIEAFRVVAAENVALIKSIPRKYHAEVEQKVWNAVRNGSDLNKLSTELRKAHGSTIKRAALIARDQNAKAKATIERVRQQELGITRGIWMHSHAGKEPRPTHVAMNNKPYDLNRGMWDSDEGEWVHPGQLINCRCTMKPVIDGFED